MSTVAQRIAALSFALILGSFAGRTHAAESLLPDRVATTVRARGGLAAVVQTPDRFLWVAGRDGLERFDGVTFQEMRWPAGTLDRAIRHLFVRRNGTLLATAGEGRLDVTSDLRRAYVDWRGRTAGLYRLDGDRLEPVPYLRELPSPWVWAIAEDADGDLWLGTEQGLARVRGDHVVSVLGVAEGLPRPFVTALATTPRGLLIGTEDGLARWRDGRVELIAAGLRVSNLASDGKRALVGVAVPEQLLELAADDATLLATTSRSNEVMAIDRSGGVWVAHRGVLKRRAPGGTAFDDAVSGVGGARAVFEDVEGSLWIASDRDGLIQVHVTRAHALPDLGAATPFAVLERRDGTVWVSSVSGVHVFRADGEARPTRVRSFPVGPQLGTWAPRSMVEAPDGRLFLTQLEGGVLQLDPGGTAFRPVVPPSAAVGKRVSDTLFVTRKGDLLVAWDHGGLTRFPGARLDHAGEELGVAQGLCPDRYGPFAETRDGTLWIGSHEGGLTSLDRDGHARCYTTANGLASDHVAALYEDDDGALWIGSLDPAGVVRKRLDGAFERLPIGARGVPARAFGFASDDDGRLWISSDRGVFVAKKSELRSGVAPAWERYGADDGLPREECISWFQPSLARTRDGRLWVPTTGGLALFDRQADAPPPSPHVVVEAVRVAGRQTSAASPVSASVDDTLEVQFTAPSFRSAERLLFQYRLDPVERGWTDAGMQRTVRYARLPPGRHTFHVRAVDDVGASLGTPAALAIVVPPRFWQRPQVIAAVLVLLGLAVTAAHRLRVRRVAGRYSAIQAERARIARDLHDGLAQGFTSVGLHLDALRVTVADPATSEVVERARAILDRCQADARTAIWNLRAQSASRISVVEAIDRVARKASADSGASIAFRLEGPPPAADAIAEYELPLIVQEAITNALRHGRAAHVSVVLTTEASGGLRLAITDDGVGMNAPKPGGFGITSMRERAARVGGTLELDSAEGDGTEVRVVVPGVHSHTRSST